MGDNLILSKEQERGIYNLMSRATGEAISQLIPTFVATLTTKIAEGAADGGSSLVSDPDNFLTGVPAEQILDVWAKYTSGIDCEVRFSSGARQVQEGGSNYWAVGDPVTIPSQISELVPAFQSFGEISIQVGPVRVGYSWD